MKDIAWMGLSDMNQEETRTLREKGEDAWNAWALDMLERKQALEDAGNWTVDWFGEGQNSETKAWLSDAQADFEGVEFAADASFSNFVFPGPAVFDKAHFAGKAEFTNVNFGSAAQFQGARFDGEVSFTKSKFHDLANFDDAVFAASCNYEKTEFLRETTGPLVPAARFQKTHFCSRADFRTSRFTGNAEFIRSRFAGSARFDEAIFQTEATFENASFEVTAGFVKTCFKGAAKFSQAQFLGEARLAETEFQDTANFEDAAFTGKTTFRNSKFGGDATFQTARFAEATRFNEVAFAKTVIFRASKFADAAEFSHGKFDDAVDFGRCKFGEDTHFEEVVFSGAAEFPSANFKNRASFKNVKFHSKVNFLQAVFRGRVTFQNASFKETAEFSAMRSRAPFVLSGARFQSPPNFQDASFIEAPSLDHMTIKDPVSIFPARGVESNVDPRPFLFRMIKACGDPDYAIRYSRLRKLAADTQDCERESEFFAQELRCRRFWFDKPLGRGWGRFWLGWIYGGISNFGRSLSRPVCLWILSIFVFSLVYLAQRQPNYFLTAPVGAVDEPPIFPVWPAHLDFEAVLQWAGSAIWWFVISLMNLFAGGGCISGESGATGEALFLSLKNSLFFIGWESPDASRRVYSCLYGFENVSGLGEQVVRVPLSVSTAAITQNILGVIFIVLVIIALRNSLRAR